MRLFFAFDNVRSALGTSAPNRNLGAVAYSVFDSPELNQDAGNIVKSLALQI